MKTIHELKCAVIAAFYWQLKNASHFTLQEHHKFLAMCLPLARISKRPVEEIMDELVDDVNSPQFSNIKPEYQMAKKASVEVKATKATKTKADAPVKKAKAAPVEVEGAVRTRFAHPDEAKIKVLDDTNPCREGTGRHEAFANIFQSATVGAYRECGYKMKYLTMAVEAGLITIG